MSNLSLEEKKEMEETITVYFEAHFLYKEIVWLLEEKHNWKISVRTLKRILRKLGLKRKNVPESDWEDVILAIEEEVLCEGCNLGYRALWLKLRLNYKFVVKRDTVYEMLKIIDPEGVANRFGNRLSRREYKVPGSNFILHIDGHDKLKKFGFPIHGGIDGFSKCILWLEVATTNNDPDVIATFYLKAVKKYGLPTIVRSDKGTENASVECLQIALRLHHDDFFAGRKSFIKGRSVRNQRIESWWRQLRRMITGFFIDLFKKMENDGLFNGSPLHKACLQFCFGKLIKFHLESTKEQWNAHAIRKQAGRNVIAGKPIILYNCPQQFGGVNCARPVDSAAIDALLRDHAKEPKLVNPTFVNLMDIIYPDAPQPTAVEEALILYERILNLIENLDLDDPNNSLQSSVLSNL